MGKKVDVDPEVLTAASRNWDSIATELDGAGNRLAIASVADLAPTVAGAAGRFLDTWANEIGDCSDEAGEHRDALRDASGYYVAMDQETAEKIRALLPWEHRAASIITVHDPLLQPGI